MTSFKCGFFGFIPAYVFLLSVNTNHNIIAFALRVVVIPFADGSNERVVALPQLWVVFMSIVSIILLSAPSKIGSAVISWVTVIMKTVLTGRSPTFEGLNDESMNIESFLFAVFTKHNAKPVFRYGHLFQHSIITNRVNPSPVRDFIKSPISINVFPLLTFHRGTLLL